MVDGEEIWESNTRGGRGRRVGPLGVEEVVKRRRGIRIKITITIRNTIKSKIKSKSKKGFGDGSYLERRRRISRRGVPMAQMRRARIQPVSWKPASRQRPRTRVAKRRTRRASPRIRRRERGACIRLIIWREGGWGRWSL